MGFVRQSNSVSGSIKIKTDKPHVEVSWQVTEIRHDKFAEANRSMIVQNKTDAEKNICLYAPNCRNKP